MAQPGRDRGTQGRRESDAAEVLALARGVVETVLPPELHGFKAAVPSRPASRDLQHRGLPVLCWAEDLSARSAPQTRELTAALAAGAGHLAWGQTYCAEDISPAFLERYGWCELLGSRGHFVSDDLALGVLLLGPETAYPLHRHEAEEIYIVLSGTAFWRKGAGSDETPVPPGSVVHHPPWTPHAMRTEAEPLLALYLWRGGDLAQKSRLS